MGSNRSSNAITISIVLTVYNHERHLARALESILKQKVNFSYEVVVGDDASSDNSKSIILDYSKRYPNIFIPILRTVNFGGSKNFTDLLRHCRGKYVTFIDGDDYWIDDNKLQIQNDYLENNPNVFSVTHKVRICDSVGNHIGMVPSDTFTEGQITIKNVLGGKRFALTATMMRAVYGQDLEDLISLVESGPRNAGDLTIALYLLEKGSIPILNNPMSVYYFRSTEGDSNYNSITIFPNRIRNRINLINVNDRYYAGKYYFGWMYIRLAISASRGLINNQLKFTELVLLVLQITLIFAKTSLYYGCKKIGKWQKIG